ncbi:MAG: hypothetical protein ACFLMY_05920 [Candidatus Brachytrichaceae bacterium NZ_4S206]|jgi:hypothetical protein
MKLVDALAALDAKSFERLCRRRGLSIDPTKRLSAPEQAARQLADHVRRVPLDELPEPAQKVVWLLALSPDGAPRVELGGGALPLLERDLAFPVPGAPERLAMPVEFRVQLPPGPGEDRASARALLAVQDEEVWALLGTQLLGRRPVGPAPLWLGGVLDALESPAGIDGLLSTLSPKQRRLLEAIEARGAQLETDELLELERSPIRLTLEGGAALPTRSASYHLHVRGLLLSRSRGLWTVPTEVAAHVGAARRAVERAERKRLLARVTEDEDLSPPRAALAEDPGAATVALLVALRQRDALPPDGRGVRRTDLKAAASHAGVPFETAELLVALARAAGARLEHGTLGEVHAMLLGTWRDTGTWDEARRDPDVHRAGEALAQLATPTRALRDVLLDLLEAMPPERFAPIDEVAKASTRDLRASGAQRLLERATRKAADRFLAHPVDVARRVLLESLPALGAADRARVDGVEVVRLSVRARRWLEGARERHDEPSRWDGGGRLRVGRGARVRAILAAAEGAQAIASEGALTLRVDESSTAAALERGLDTETLRARLEELASPVEAAALRALVRGAEANRPQVRIVPASAFLPIDEPGLRERISSEPALRGYWVSPSPEGGLLVRAGVSFEELASALQRLGIVLHDDET